MEITKNTVVTLDYTVKDPEGSLIDDGHHPLVYLHGGYEGIFAVIEEALQGKKVGDNLKVKLLPEDAFGEFDEELVLVEDASMFPDNIEVGMSFERVAEEGHAAQHDEGADNGTDYPYQNGGDQPAHHKGVGKWSEQEIKHVRGPPLRPRRSSHRPSPAIGC